MIRGPEVLALSLAAFLPDNGAPDLAERIMLGLEAGGKADGDNRCPFECPAMTAGRRPGDQNPEEPALFPAAPRSYTVREAIEL